MTESKKSSMRPPAEMKTRRMFGGVLIGGGSTRMGRAKHLLEFEGRTFLDRVVAALSTCVERVYLIGAGDVPIGHAGFSRIADAGDAAGPMAGVLAALRARPDADWVIVACDMPLVSARAVDWLVRQRDSVCCAVLPRTAADRVEPLLAVYKPAARSLLEALAAAGEFSLQRLVGARIVRPASEEVGHPHPSAVAPAQPVSSLQVFCPAPPAELVGAWRNVNTPEELGEIG